ncbi:hypothetical protein CSG_15870 [Campylobacter fetus subsp. venerealis str. 84-112]|uniref:Uncharacterized protein n=1 Tax=Campylobacter fetus subsp. fetus (strain 82-40) TaxID=360106 RepID=A0RQV3_CAMFF|nr:hypothetical protein CFF8240_1447 [Campylobacter fetus subsp. fetus 82-40]CDF65498.1 hypothetical protein CSG_15870 [Campylobacter fetus subsp. venerealis str. 84-112]
MSFLSKNAVQDVHNLKIANRVNLFNLGQKRFLHTITPII